MKRTITQTGAYMWCLVLLLLVQPINLFAQDRLISGTIKDNADGSLLPGVNVSISGTTKVLLLISMVTLV